MEQDLIDASVLLRREALARGMTDASLGRCVRSGALVRVRQGAYVDGRVWREADRRERQRIASRAVMRQYGDNVALSHASAAVRYGAPDWGLDLGPVHLTHLDGGGRRAAGVVHHEGTIRLNDVRRLDDAWITTPARTVVDTIAGIDVEAGVVTASWFLHEGLVTEPELIAAHQARAGWPGTLTDRVALSLADGRFESVGESRAAYLFWREGLPAPVPQFEVFRPNGKLAGRADFAWPELGLLCEFDGLLKYRRPWPAGAEPAEIVVAEKAREDLLREITGWRIIRLVWADLARPHETASRIRALMKLSA